MNVYLRQQKMHDIEIEKAKLSIEAKEKAALEEEDCWIYALIGVKPPTPMVEKSIEEMVLVRTGLVQLEHLTLNFTIDTESGLSRGAGCKLPFLAAHCIWRVQFYLLDVLSDTLDG